MTKDDIEHENARVDDAPYDHVLEKTQETPPARPKQTFLVDFPLTIYATETIEASDKEEAQAIANQLLESWDFFKQRLLPTYRDVQLDQAWENCDTPIVQHTTDREPTMTEAHVRQFVPDDAETKEA